MTKVIQLVAQEVFRLPALLACPLMGVCGIDGTGRVEIAVRLLGSCYDIEHRVDISLQLLVWEGLEHIRGTLDGLVDIGIIEGETHELGHVPLRSLQSGMTWMLEGIGRHLEILITMFALTFRESQGDGHLTGRLDAVAPEGVWCYFHRGEWYLGIRIPALGQAGKCACHQE